MNKKITLAKLNGRVPKSADLSTAAGRKKLARRHFTAQPAIKANLPLAIGTHRDLRDTSPENCRKHCQRLLRAHVRSPLYLAAVAAEKSQRHSLGGGLVEPVSDEHRAKAQAMLNKFNTKTARAV